MSRSLEIKKLYIDSRYRTSDSISDSNFKIQLNRNITLPEGCVMRVENAIIPHSWLNIEFSINDRMYLVVNINGSSPSYAILTIPTNQYIGSTLATALQTLFNANWSGIFTVGYTVALNTIDITIGGNSNNSFKVLTDAELATSFGGVWAGATYDTSMPNSCNDIITNRSSKWNYFGSTWHSGMINLEGFRAVYISSSNLSSYNVQGPQGENNIIKKVITTSDFGYLIVDQVVSDHDYLDVGKLTLNTIDFQIRDVKGNLVPFHDSPVSFTIVFGIKE